MCEIWAQRYSEQSNNLDSNMLSLVVMLVAGAVSMESDEGAGLGWYVDVPSPPLDFIPFADEGEEDAVKEEEVEEGDAVEEDLVPENSQEMAAEELVAEGCEEVQEGGEEVQEEPKTEEQAVEEEEEPTTEMAGVAAQILHLDLSEILERPADTWAAVVNQAFRSCARMCHSDKGGDREVFADCKQAQQTLRQWLQLYEVKCKTLQELFQEFSGCWCSKCHNLFARMSCCQACLGLNTRRGHKGCGFQKGFLMVRKSFPRHWGAFLRLLAHGKDFATAKQEIAEAHFAERVKEKKLEELRKEQAKREEMLEHESWQRRLKRRKLELEDEAVAEFAAETGLTPDQLRGLVDEMPQAPVIQVNAVGGTSTQGGSSASGHRAPSAPPVLPTAAPGSARPTAAPPAAPTRPTAAPAAPAPAAHVPPAASAPAAAASEQAIPAEPARCPGPLRRCPNCGRETARWEQYRPGKRWYRCLRHPACSFKHYSPRNWD